jgi:hypothetical protein
MRYAITLLLLLVVAAGCNRSKKLDEAQLKARQVVKNLGATIQGLKSVTVTFQKKDIQDSDLAALLDLENVSYLDLTGTTVGDEAMTYLPRIKGLQIVVLKDTQVTDAGMSHLEQVAELVQLICNQSIGDEGLASLATADKLNFLNLENSRVTDDGLAHLVALKNLRRLNLNETGITDKGLEHVQQMSNLHSLRLHGTKITDKGLPLLENLSNLTALIISNTDVTPVAVARLQAALPDTGIDSDTNMGSPMGSPSGNAGGGGGGRPGGGGRGSFNPEAVVKRVMESNDKDEDGILSAEEIEGISEQFRSRLQAADTDEDGTISKDELLKYFTDRAAQRGSEGGGRPGGGGGGRPGGGGGGRPGGEGGQPGAEPAEEQPEGDSADRNQGGILGSLFRAVSSGTQKALATSAADTAGGKQ